ncbi:MAG: Crp/Fnr family transcriptional regulator [Polyangiaceae bacterium]|nr:Crp/Fnr family transcriptional regulator [Polyangiaceae bacterium]
MLTMKERLIDASLFRELEGDGRHALLELGVLERIPRRTRVAQQGEPAKNLLVIGSGRVKLERANGDRLFAIDHRGPGETVGETALAGNAHMTESAVVLDDAEVLCLPLSGLRKLVANDDSIRKVMLGILASTRLAAEQRLESLLLHGVEARLVDFLLASMKRWGEPHPAGQVISAPFTHADIALLVGSTRETVTLVLGKLKRAGLIDLEKRRIVVRDEDALNRHAVTA